MGPPAEDVATNLPKFQRFISNSLEGKRLVKKRLQDISKSASIVEEKEKVSSNDNFGSESTSAGSSDLKKVVTNSLGGLRKKLSSRFLSAGTDSGDHKSNEVGGDSKTKSSSPSAMPTIELKSFKSTSLEGRNLVKQGRNVVQGRLQRMSIVSEQIASFDGDPATFAPNSSSALPMPELKPFKSGTLEGKNLVQEGRNVVQGRLRKMSIISPSSNHSMGSFGVGDSESFSPSMPELKTFKSGSLEGKNLVQEGRNVVQERLGDMSMPSTPCDRHGGGMSVGGTDSTSTQSYALPMPGLQKMVSNSLEGLKKTMQDFSTSPATGNDNGGNSMSNSSPKHAILPTMKSSNKRSSLRGFGNLVKGTFIPVGKTSKHSLDDDSSDDNNLGPGRVRDTMPAGPDDYGCTSSGGVGSRPAMKPSSSLRGFTNFMKGTFIPVGKSPKSSLEDDSSDGNNNHGQGRLRDIPAVPGPNETGTAMDSTSPAFSAPTPELKEFFSNSLEGMRNLVMKGRFIPGGKTTKQPLDGGEEEFIPGRLPPNKGTTEGEKAGKEEEEFIPGRLQLLHGSFLDKENQHKHEEEFIPGRLPLNKGTLEGERAGNEEEFVPGRLQLLHGNFLGKDDQHKHQEDFIPGRIPPNKGKVETENEEEFLPGKLQLLHGNFLEKQASKWNSNHTQTTCTDLTQEGSGSLTFIDDFLGSDSSSSHDKDVVVDLGNTQYAVKQTKQIQTEALSEEDKIYKAACCIQRFFQYTKEVYAYHKEEIMYWEKEKADVLRRHREELAGVRRQLQMEKDQTQVEMQAEMEREQAKQSCKAKAELPSVIDWTLSYTSFSWVQDVELMQEIQQEKETQKKLKEWIRVCSNWNRQLALDESNLNRSVQDAKALLRRVKKIALVKKKISAETFRKERIMNCILQVTQLVKSRIGDERALKILNQHLDKRDKPKLEQAKKSTSSSASKRDGGRSKSPRRDQSPRDTRSPKRKSSPAAGAKKEPDAPVARASSPPKLSKKKDAKKRDSGRSRSLTRRSKSPQPSSSTSKSNNSGSGRKRQSKSLSPVRSSGKKGTRRSIKQSGRAGVDAMRQSVIGSACFLDLIEMDSSMLDLSSRASLSK